MATTAWLPISSENRSAARTLVGRLLSMGIRFLCDDGLRLFGVRGAGLASQWRERRTSEPMSRISATRPSPMIVAPDTSCTLR